MPFKTALCGVTDFFGRAMNCHRPAPKALASPYRICFSLQLYAVDEMIAFEGFQGRNTTNLRENKGRVECPLLFVLTSLLLKVTGKLYPVIVSNTRHCVQLLGLESIVSLLAALHVFK